jgi:hypothetical protein
MRPRGIVYVPRHLRQHGNVGKAKIAGFLGLGEGGSGNDDDCG